MEPVSATSWRMGASANDEKSALAEIANREKFMPKEFIREDGFGITEACRRYLSPLIQGEDFPPFENGLPKVAKLKLAKVERRLQAREGLLKGLSQHIPGVLFKVLVSSDGDTRMVYISERAAQIYELDDIDPASLTWSSHYVRIHPEDRAAVESLAKTADFEVLRSFVQDQQFDRVGVFTYSYEADTPSGAMPKRVSVSVSAPPRLSVPVISTTNLLTRPTLRSGMLITCPAPPVFRQSPACHPCRTCSAARPRPCPAMWTPAATSSAIATATTGRRRASPASDRKRP